VRILKANYAVRTAERTTLPALNAEYRPPLLRY